MQTTAYHPQQPTTLVQTRGGKGLWSRQRIVIWRAKDERSQPMIRRRKIVGPGGPMQSMDMFNDRSRTPILGGPPSITLCSRHNLPYEPDNSLGPSVPMHLMDMSNGRPGTSTPGNIREPDPVLSLLPYAQIADTRCPDSRCSDSGSVPGAPGINSQFNSQHLSMNVTTTSLLMK